MDPTVAHSRSRTRLRSRQRWGQWTKTSLILGILTLTIAGCSRTQQTAQQTTLPVREGNIVQQVSGSGKIEANRESFLNFVTTGTVAQVRVEEGQQVKQGDVLAS